MPPLKEEFRYELKRAMPVMRIGKLLRRLNLGLRLILDLPFLDGGLLRQLRDSPARRPLPECARAAANSCRSAVTWSISSRFCFSNRSSRSRIC